MEEREHNVPHFLDLIRRSRRGKFKVYIGMIAGVGKTYRMLQEAHEMMDMWKLTGVPAQRRSWKDCR